MKIIKIETIPVRLPTRRAHQWANLTTPIGVYVIVRVETDEGLVGLGEAPVLKDWGGDYMRYYGETPKTTMHIINDIIAPALTGEDPRRIEAAHSLMDRAIKGYPYAKAAIDMALYDIVGKTLSVPAYQLLGGCYRERVTIAHSIGLMEIEKAVEEALQVKEEGIKTVKLKGGQEPKRDVELVKQVRRALGPEIEIGVDANQGYVAPKVAVKTIEAMEEHTVRMALEISRKIVHRELTIDPDLVAALASVALKRVHGHQSITLRVSRQDFDFIRSAVAAVNPAVAVKDDASLERGDFVIDTAQTHLDVRVSNQVDTIGRALFDE